MTNAMASILTVGFASLGLVLWPAVGRKSNKWRRAGSVFFIMVAIDLLNLKFVFKGGPISFWNGAIAVALMATMNMYLVVLIEILDLHMPVPWPKKHERKDGK